KLIKPARRIARRPSKPPRPARAAAAPVPAPAPAPLAGEERIGIVTHYYGELSVAAVRIESGSLRVGDTIHVVGHTSDFRQRVESMQLEHESVAEAGAGQEIGLKVSAHAREHDVVYKAAA
ncbi:MAG: EF-Tu/IF-2/RF-3 family GTPase, partial [Burkholderiales bacterium]